jgi:hypothetical protein
MVVGETSRTCVNIHFWPTRGVCTRKGCDRGNGLGSRSRTNCYIRHGCVTHDLSNKSAGGGVTPTNNTQDVWRRVKVKGVRGRERRLHHDWEIWQDA